MKQFQWLRGGPHFKFLSEIPPDEFVKVFAMSVDKPFYFSTGLIGSTPFLGTLLPHGRFRLEQPGWYLQSGMRYLNGCVRPSGSGSEITGSFSANPFVILIAGLGLGIVFTFGAVGCCAGAASLFRGNPNALWVMLWALPALVGSALAAVFSTVISEADRDTYSDFFRQKFGAELVEIRD